MPPPLSRKCVVPVGHPHYGDDFAEWYADGTDMVVCGHHKHTYETAYADYSHLKWRLIPHDTTIRP